MLPQVHFIVHFRRGPWNLESFPSVCLVCLISNYYVESPSGFLPYSFVASSCSCLSRSHAKCQGNSAVATCFLASPFQLRFLIQIHLRFASWPCWLRCLPNTAASRSYRSLSSPSSLRLLAEFAAGTGLPGHWAVADLEIFVGASLFLYYLPHSVATWLT